MTNTNFQRLLWREYREGWPVIAAFVVLPSIFFPISVHFPESYLASAMVLMVMFAIPFTAVLWASEKRRTVKQGRDIHAAVLPVTPFQDWTASFLLPALVVGISGGWMYSLYAGTPVAQSEGIVTPIYGFVVTIIAFMLSSFLSKSASHIVGIIAGTLWILGTFPLFSGQRGISLEMAVVPLALAAAAFGISEFRKVSPRQIRTFAMATLVILGVLVLHRGVAQTLKSLRTDLIGEQPFLHDYGPLWTEDAVEVTRESVDVRGLDTIKFVGDTRLRDSESGKALYYVTHQFPTVALPVAVDSKRRVYLLSQRPGGSEVSVIRWDPKSDRAETVCTFSGRRGIDKFPANWWLQATGPMQAGWADPEGTRLILRLRSVIGTGQDLWLIDLTTGRSKLLVANSWFAWDKATWTEDKVYLTGFLPSLEVNTGEYTVKPLMPERKDRG